MRKLLILTGFLLVLVGCTKQHQQPTKKPEPVIDYMCKDASEDVLTPEEIEWWDERNAEGGTLIVRGAERELDTIVNHSHMKFITDP